MSTLDTSVHSQSCSMFPCTHVRDESIDILHKVYIHKLHQLQINDVQPSWRHCIGM